MYVQVFLAFHMLWRKAFSQNKKSTDIFAHYTPLFIAPSSWSQNKIIYIPISPKGTKDKLSNQQQQQKSWLSIGPNGQLQTNLFQFP